MSVTFRTWHRCRPRSDTGLESSKTRHLCSQFGFALLGQELPKLGCEGRERVGEEQPFFSWILNRIF